MEQALNKRERLGSVDGMRGIAALAVVLFHLGGALREPLAEILPDWVMIALSYGYLGVPIFFVISGLVISRNIKEGIDKRYAGMFILRRSLRLDPTYWAAIIIAISTTLAKSFLFDQPVNLPSVSGVLLHFVYLQDIFTVEPSISVVYWTLCLEVQFYLFFLLSKWACEKISTFLSRPAAFMHGSIILLVACWSLAIDVKVIEFPWPGIFVRYWHYFYLGVLVSCCISRAPWARTIFTIWCVILIASQIAITPLAYILAALLSAIGFYSLWKLGLSNQVLVSKPLQFLGMISYSLYLIHPDIGWKFISLNKAVLGENLTPWMALLIFLLAIMVSLFSALILYRVVERPSLSITNALRTKSPRILLQEWRTGSQDLKGAAG
ncbi:acyltransferase family protein [Simiduia aestuariiviva]|uniref:Acyltransferase 3 domain-containing protein n=1 Tax=Simiduia aestuariiviva TaxID=1510459 RepID=A0A839UX96_9GAMM|nr:acyltransferase [Simiduia aestuariiviva]MBB3170078.1 hypothetical protein [Simiduia aestuariiviva]